MASDKMRIPSWIGAQERERIARMNPQEARTYCGRLMASARRREIMPPREDWAVSGRGHLTTPYGEIEHFRMKRARKCASERQIAWADFHAQK